ncbi:MAG TPA: dethiobiotin synthase [Nitrospiria bacterium]
MYKGLFITGTDTGVGKTIVTAGLALALKNTQRNVGVMKPIATGCFKKKEKFESPDTQFLVQASGVTDPLSLITPYCLKTPCSPYWAAKIENRKIRIDRIIDAFSQLSGKHEIVLVEGLGGLMAPITRRILLIDLAKILNLPILIVSRSTLGTINHTLLSIAQAHQRGVPILGLIYNHPQKNKMKLHERVNPRIISSFSKIKNLGTIPYLKDVSVEKRNLKGLKRGFEEMAIEILKNLKKPARGKTGKN